MISELDFLFDKKIEIFCDVNNFEYINIIKLMLGKHRTLASRIIESNKDDLSKNHVFNIEEFNSINNAYQEHVSEIKEKSEKIATIGNLNESNLSNTIFKSQDLIRRLSKKPMIEFDERINLVNSLDSQAKNIDLYRKKLAMELMDKSVKDARFFCATKNKIL